MSAIANIVVPDAATTPVNHTFVPQKVSGELASWQEKSAATPQGYWNYTLAVRDPVNGGKVYRITRTMDMPILKSYTDLSGNPVTVVDYTLRHKEEFLIPVASTLQNRKDFRKLVGGILGESQAVDVIENLNHPY